MLNVKIMNTIDFIIYYKINVNTKNLNIYNNSNNKIDFFYFVNLCSLKIWPWEIIPFSSLYRFLRCCNNTINDTRLNPLSF